MVEGHHHGRVLAVDAGGTVRLCRGDPDALVLPRSSNKPLQLVGMLRAGLSRLPGLDPPLLAVAAASHSGEEEHVRAVTRLLDLAGLGPDALDNTPDLPVDPAAAARLLAAGGGPDRIHQNCSGKHAAMVATCRVAGWPVAGYRDPGHPLQRALADSVAQLAGQPIRAVAVDGCGAPLFGLSLSGLAAAFSRVVRAAPGTPERAVADAMRGHPGMVGGTGRPVTRLMSAVPGLFAKDGAEGVFAAALPDGSAVAVKIDDGGARAAAPVLLAALATLGVDPTEPSLADLAAPPVLGHGEPVGSVRAVIG